MVNQLVRYRMVFTGRVQGVGFRYTANNAANQYHLTGYVKNEYDGSVTVEVQGAEEAIYLFIKSLASDRYIGIDDMQKQQIPIEADERGFIVQY
ncbi:acylphosphatase [Pseudobutyrivibrio ruminis]|uniref:acylphosphatase n=1 Tax=Pseudobutyrivibrio ruminis TaxID=46206 RepID=A0A1H7IFU0_9FIRM|nr:acylphosphatase [Pseudobutyrivibrio ruminis]SEK61366.1 acylphosphatase [Pseudobutyrivibrio ruminis]